jgi:hypothetical protein
VFAGKLKENDKKNFIIFFNDFFFIKCKNKVRLTRALFLLWFLHIFKHLEWLRFVPKNFAEFSVEFLGLGKGT